MSKFKVGDRVRRLPQYRNRGGWNRGDEVMVVAGFGPGGWLHLRGYTVDGSDEYATVSPRRFELVQGQMLARDELYMRLRNDAGLSHADATAFIKECPPYEEIRHALDGGYPTARIMSRLVVWETTPQRRKFWSDHAQRAGWLK